MGRPFVSFQRQQDQIWFINVSRTLFFFVPDVRTGTFSLFAENLSPLSLSIYLHHLSFNPTEDGAA